LLVLVVIAATAGAAAAVGFGVAAALWTKFSRTASKPDYEPWNFDNTDKIVQNPLYETQSKEVDNPLYKENQN
jgi:hypothetical protein